MEREMEEARHTKGPDIDTQSVAETFRFLDELRASGRTNMYGAVPYILAEFPMTRREAEHLLTKWFSLPLGPLEERARAAIAKAEPTNPEARTNG
jgi:hypothetical protein